MERKKRMRKTIQTLFVCLLVGLTLFKSVSIDASDHNNPNLTEKISEVEVVLKKSILPGNLPGKMNSSIKDTTDFKEHKHPISRNSITRRFPKTGFNKNNWLYLGTILLASSFLFILIKNKRK